MTTTITYREVEFEVEFDYQPYEPPEAHYPGCPECVEQINALIHGDTDFLEFIENEEDIKELIIESITE